MAAGAWKDWAEGELVTEALFQDIQDSIAFIYASESAANTALTNKVEGTQFYDTGADLLKIWDGSAWVAVGATKVKQIKVVDGDETGDETVSTTNYGVTSLTASITPSSTSNKILVTVSADFDIRQFTGGALTQRDGYIGIARNNTASVGSAQNGTLVKAFLVGRYLSGTSTSAAQILPSGTYSFIDSPSSTSSTSYTLTIGILNTFIQTTYQNGSGNKSQIILQEIETV